MPPRPPPIAGAWHALHDSPRREGALTVHVVIMGCGRLGSTLAHKLDERGHSVAVIDQNADAFRRLGPDFHGTTVTGIGFDRDVLRDAGIERADAFAAVSSGDNSNIISARLARETYGVSRVVARIYDSRRALVYEHLVPDSVVEVFRDPTSAVSIVEAPLHRDWVGKTLKSLEEATGARVAYLMRFGIGSLATPSTVLQDGDQVFMLVTDDTVGPVLEVASGAEEGGQ
jgi:trk system potassium uptake protein TrkA